MSVVKIKFVKHLKNLVRYVFAGLRQNDPVDCHNCSRQTVAEDFESVARLHQGKGSIDAIHIVQSWNEEESKKLFPSEVNEMGRSLAEQKFPGHAFTVVTHTDTGKVHNHIIVSPWHSETGKKIENKKHHLYQLRNINDSISKAKGLSVIDSRGKDRLAKMPEKVQKMMQCNGRSWLLDLCQKADFARAYSTSYGEYTGILGELGVRARVEEKNVTYFYPGKERGKRGNKLGHFYDKKGLEEAFKANDQKFAAAPYLREQIVKEKARHLIPQGYKDYNRFTSTPRETRAPRFPHEVDLKTSLLPLDEIRRARCVSILDYCRRSNIGLERNGDGKHVLKGRPFVEVDDYGWVNKKNRTKGTLIELVAAHKKLTFLQAIAEINGNKRLLKLEQHFGEVKRNFTSFHIPKADRRMGDKAIAHVGKWLSHYGGDSRHAKDVLKSDQVQVDGAGVIRLFGKDDDGGAWQFSEHREGEWKKEKIGSFKKSFFTSSSIGNKARVYTDPFLFLKHYGGSTLGNRSCSDVICLMEPDSKLLSLLLSGKPRLDRLDFVTTEPTKHSEREIDFFNTLSSECASFGMRSSFLSGEKAVPSRNRGLEI